VLKYDASHKFAKLIGSPPGYPEHRNTHPLSKQEVMKQFPTANVNFSVALFNEIEKAWPADSQFPAARTGQFGQNPAHGRDREELGRRRPCRH
jgi:hypothetical protein